MALAARAVKADRAAYAEAIDGGELVLGPSLRAAIHAVPPGRPLPLRPHGDLRGRRRARPPARPGRAEEPARARDRPDGRARRGHRGDSADARRRSAPGSHGPSRRAARAGAHGAPAVVQGVSEQPRLADAVALRGRRRRHADGLGAALSLRAPRPAAQGRRPRPRLRALLRAGGGQGLFRVGGPGARAGAAAVGRDRRRAGGGRVEGRSRLDRRRRPPGPGLAAAGLRGRV